MTLHTILIDFCNLPHPTAGWLLQYVDKSNVKTTIVNEGMADRTVVTPYYFASTASANQQSVMWIGRYGPLEIRQLVQLDNSGLFFTTAVTIKNIDTGPAKGIYCK